MSSTNYNIRIDQDLKERAFSIIESYGLSPAQAIKLFLNQIADTHTIPLNFDYKYKPNALTQQAMLEAINELKSAKKYDSFNELLEDLKDE